MPEIDNLNISISAESKKASTAIDNLIAKLNKLETNLSSLGKANVSGLSGVTSDVAKAVKNLDGLNTATFTRVTNTFKKLSDIDSTNIYVLSSALNGLGTASQCAQNVGDLAKNLSKLGNKGVRNAITNIPQLATAMNQLFTTLSKSPKVSNNIIQMTNALANLASQGQKISVASNAMANGINRYSASARNAKRHTTSLAAAFGKFYASYFLVIRGIKALWGTVETASDYLETLNYFEEAFGHVAKTADLSQWEELGYESAEAYASSFSKRASELTAKMTGFQVLSDGTLQSTGLGSLGINPSDVMQYQAMFGQMSSSMGVASETALKLSDALTMIGADLASVRNMNFDVVWKDMASGLAGMSRTLDKYGVNIRNVNLQQKLNELGIEANIQALNQNEKALLRAIILLENTKYAWGDLAETLNAPANQLRLLSSNMENLGRIMGSLFLPTVQKVLPYINGLVIALQRLFTWIGTAMGIDLSGIVDSTGENPLDEVIGGSEELEETLGDTLEASEKLKKSLRGFDELKTISSETASLTTGTDVSLGITGGVLDTAFEQSLAEYQKAWDEAFANMENKAEEFADKIEGYLEPVKKIFEGIIVGDYITVGENSSKIIEGITSLFSDAIKEIDWEEIGLNIADFISSINWSETLGNLSESANNIAKGFLNLLSTAIENVDWEEIGNSIGKFLEEIEWVEILSLAGEVVWKAINAAIKTWESSFDVAPIETTIATGLAALAFTNLSLPNLLSGITSAIGKAITGGVTISEILLSISKFTFSNPVGMEIGNELLTKVEDWIEENFGEEVLNAMGEALMIAVSAGIGLMFGGPIGALVGGIIGLIIDSFSTDGFARDVLTTIAEKVFNFSDAKYFFDEMKQNFTDGLNGSNIFEIGGNIVEGILNGMVGVLVGIVEPFKDLFDWFIEGICDLFGIHSPATETEFIGENIVLGILNGFKNSFSEVTETLQEFADKVYEFFENSFSFDFGIETEIEPVNGKLVNSEKVKSKTIGVSLDTKMKKNNFLNKIQKYETGGYPKKASLAWVGENGIPEIIGTIGGKTAVAGGAEITGISDAVYSTGETEASLLRTAVGLLQIIAEKEFGVSDSQIFNSVKRSENENFRRTGNSIFVH